MTDIVGAGDDYSYASSLSSTPILQLKKKKLKKKQNHSNNNVANTISNRKSSSAFTAVSVLEKINSSSPSYSNNKVTSTTTTSSSSSSSSSSPADKDSDKDNGKDEKTDKGDEEACCLCHCGIDCSDRALFFPKDRKKEIADCVAANSDNDSDDDSDQEDYYFTMEDPYLPSQLYDPHNALVYCDSCDRMFHQKCHFVPIFVLPRGDWNCLICTSNSSESNNKKKKKKKNKLLFNTPPNPIQRHEEQIFEVTSRHDKAVLWNQQLKSVKTFLNSQASNIRMAKAALHTLTSTKRNVAMIIESQKQRRTFQELAETLLRMTTAKYRMRQMLISLEDYRTKTSDTASSTIDPQLLKDWCDNYPQHVQHILPNGLDLFLKHKRIIPRTAEMKLDKQEEEGGGGEKGEATRSGVGVPNEIMCSPSCFKIVTTTHNSGSSSSDGDGDDGSPKTENPTTDNKKQNSNNNNNGGDDDDDSGITLDDLKCSVCLTGESTDENDVILCDGQGCYRAFHMKCVHPAVTEQDIENEDDDWFCPLCLSISTLTHKMQIACEGEEEDFNEEESDMEWDTPRDVFPNSKWEYETALKYSQGKQNDDINALLTIYLGQDIGTINGSSNNNNIPMNPIGSDSEDENDYSLFDEESFAERKRKENGNDDNDVEDDEDDSDDESDRDSQATWLSSSVEMNIGRAELAALSEEDDDDSEDDDSDSSSNNSSQSGNGGGSGRRRKRKSRRLRAKQQRDRVSAIAANSFGADFDESNIVEGKRRRKTVDYRKLNDSLFGTLSETQKRKLDDGDDYHRKKKRKKKKAKESLSSSSSAGEENDDEEKEEEEDQNMSDSKDEGGDAGSDEQSNSNNSGSDDGSDSSDASSDSDSDSDGTTSSSDDDSTNNNESSSEEQDNNDDDDDDDNDTDE